MHYHRQSCEQWQARHDAKGLARKRQARSRRKAGRSAAARCIFCKRDPERHHKGCPFSFDRDVRRRLLDRHEAEPLPFLVLLRALTRRYQHEDEDE